jgi:hypothetical protein
VNHLSRAFGLLERISAGARLYLRPLAVVATFAAVSFAWVFFRAPDVATALAIVRGMTGANGWHTLAMSQLVDMLPLYFLIVWLMPNTLEIFRDYHPAIHGDDYTAGETPGLIERRLTFDFSTRWAVTGAIVFIVAWLAISSLSPFIYFQF